jgi:hypothetical protein
MLAAQISRVPEIDRAHAEVGGIIGKIPRLLLAEVLITAARGKFSTEVGSALEMFSLRSHH